MALRLLVHGLLGSAVAIVLCLISNEGLDPGERVHVVPVAEGDPGVSVHAEGSRDVLVVGAIALVNAPQVRDVILQRHILWQDTWRRQRVHLLSGRDLTCHRGQGGFDLLALLPLAIEVAFERIDLSVEDAKGCHALCLLGQ